MRHDVSRTSPLWGRSATTLTALALLIGGCMYSPLDGTDVPNRSATLTFSGATSKPNQQIELRQHRTDENDAFPIEYTMSSSTPSTDVAGTKWYQWSIETYLSHEPWFWTQKSTRGRRRMETVLSAKNNTDRKLLYTFQDTAGQCLTDTFKTQGGTASLAKCSDGGSSVTLEIPCGNAGERCCVGYNAPKDRPCTQGHYCLDDTCIADPRANAPIATAALDITFCGGASRPSWFSTNFRKGPPVIPPGGDAVGIISASEAGSRGLKPLTTSSTARFALDTQGIADLGSIPGISIRMQPGECIESVGLRVNDREVFRSNERFYYRKDFTDGELGSQWREKSSTICRPPSRMSGSTLRNIAETEVGSLMIPRSELSNAVVTTKNISDSQGNKLQTDIRLRVNELTALNCSADVTLRLKTLIDCQTTRDGGYINGNPINIVSGKPWLSGDRLDGSEKFIELIHVKVRETGCDILADLGELLDVVDVWDEASKRVVGLSSGIASKLTFHSSVPVCPNIKLVGDETPSLELDWGSNSTLNLCEP